MTEPRSEILPGTLDLVLKTLEAMAPLLGYSIARRLERLSEDVLAVKSGDRLRVLGASGPTTLDLGNLGGRRTRTVARSSM